MVTIVSSVFIKYDDDGKAVSRVHLLVDSASELPTELDGIKMSHGSTAVDTSSGVVHGMTSDGAWNEWG